LRRKDSTDEARIKEAHEQVFWDYFGKYPLILPAMSPGFTILFDASASFTTHINCSFQFTESLADTNQLVEPG